MTEHDYSGWDPEAALNRAADEDREVADELRVLLQLAAPHLPAPEDRMERVLARAARTRRYRRRAALAAGLAVGLTAAVLAAAPALAPGPTGIVLSPAASGPALGAIPPAGSPTASPAGSPGASADMPAGTPTATPTAMLPNTSPAVPARPTPEGAPGVEAGGDGSADTAEDGSYPVRPTRFTPLDGVIIDVPDAWYDRTLLAAPGWPESVGSVASQPLAREPDCPIRDGRQAPLCPASGVLADDGVFVSIRLIRDNEVVTKAIGQSVLLQDTTIDRECSAQGGTRQLRAQQVIIPTGQAEVVDLSACTRRPSKETLAMLERFAASVRLFGTATNSPVTSAG
ncbi:hypothetical protein ACFP3U_01195 [Kitasatospora misakiensis]|uniref:Uncharacterized protein n=1 Tax=Kitasatospora misakiensis TaxID=67330 RepID=A0ABW0WZD0_9ACTN